MPHFTGTVFRREENNHYPHNIQARRADRVPCPTSGERRVQLLVEEPLLPVLLLWLSDIALLRINLAQHGSDSASQYPAEENTPA